MATRYVMKVVDAETGESTSVALWDDMVPVDVLHELCVTLFENTEDASSVLCVDMETGEVVAEVAPDPSSDWGYNEDIGYDPYMGCYTNDC